MTVSDRDRKILMFLVPVVVLVGYWFLLLNPQRKESAEVGTELAAQEKKRDEAQAKLRQLESAKTTFAADYSALVRLGKAVPTNVDMPSLLVQLDEASRGTGIEFDRIATSTSGGSGSTGGAPSSTPAPPGNGNGSQPAAAGGTPAQSGPGKATETAGNATNGANAKSGASEGQSAEGGSGAGSGSSGGSASGGGPASGGGSASGGAAGGAAATCPAGLECVPLDLTFTGGFFDLADFFHRLKRFVRLANDKISVKGRLLTVDSLKFSSSDFPDLRAEMKATVYLSPKETGATAGATAQGPAASTPAASPAPASSNGAGP